MNEIEEMLAGVKEFKCQWHHLMESVDSRVDKALAVLRPQILADHRALLASLGWPPKLSSSEVENGQMSSVPNPLVLMHVDKRERYSQSFLDLCALQHVQTRREERELNFSGQKDNDVGLWAIDELVMPIASRMEYHFTKWLEQPEFIFGLAFKITEDFIVGVDDVLQPLIDKARLVRYSAKEAWVTAIVHMVSVFMEKRLFPFLAEGYKAKDLRSGVISSWLHLIDLIVAFDKRMKSLVNLDTCLFMGEHERFEGFLRGVSVLRIFCDRPEWLKIWGKIELKDGWKKLKVELKDERVWLIDKKCGAAAHIGTQSEQFLLSTREDFKAPLVAEFALKISWDMIERSETFPAILARAQFIRLAAGRFLWHFFNVLVLRCKRTEFFLDNPDDDALMRICGSINAARYIESKLHEWTDDVNFLEMKITENNSILHNRDVRNDTCFFWEEIKSLVELETNWLLEIIGVVLRQFESLCWDDVQNKGCFEQLVEHTTPDRILRVGDLTVSMGLIEALDGLRSQLEFLKTILNPKDFLDLWRSVAEGVDHYISRSILTSGIEFSSKVIDQFGVDMNALFLVFQPFCVRPEAFFPCIRETLKLLTMSGEEAKHLQLVRSNDASRIKGLRFCGISHLSFDQVDRVLRNKTL
ncbi:chromosome structural maintenance family protein [Tripterygium wilfordii]|uniref:Chromosome structural maintenance family protein n=2 Tax=Tripterygium wilfordii TaxID=458696 RepID=A0A7J7DF92_TRIWF|nr:chromosome structural maintenance family protein [Tripterygium wilfordii]